MGSCTKASPCPTARAQPHIHGVPPHRASGILLEEFACSSQRGGPKPFLARMRHHIPSPSLRPPKSCPGDAPATTPCFSPRFPSSSPAPKIDKAICKPPPVYMEEQGSALPTAGTGERPPPRLAGSAQGPGYLSVAVSSPAPLSGQ